MTDRKGSVLRKKERIFFSSLSAQVLAHYSTYQSNGRSRPQEPSSSPYFLLVKKNPERALKKRKRGKNQRIRRFLPRAFLIHY
ncbi:MAG: hypothetical protein GF308_21850 [Candidatus Heimdallarchaeota archaeon]|nr:hypothetical protein [Candidatus Heimdallarchaeota archaeon]